MATSKPTLPPGLHIRKLNPGTTFKDFMHADFCGDDAIMDHQMQNIRRMAELVLDTAKVPSLIISDDPGLGKTFSSLGSVCFTRSLVREQYFQVLIVGPLSVLPQWKSEICRFTNTQPSQVAVNVMDPNARFVLVNYEKLVALFKTCYEPIKDEQDHNRISWCRILGSSLPLPFKPDHFRFMILDEAHIFRNPKAKVYQAVCAAMPSSAGRPYPRIALTGTPIVNKPDDLRSICTALRLGGKYEDKNFYNRLHYPDNAREFQARGAAPPFETPT